LIWERLEIIGLHVEDVDKAAADFSDLFGVEFRIWESVGSDPIGIEFEQLLVSDKPSGNLNQQNRYRVAMDPNGFWELLEGPDLEVGIRNVHFKVDDIESAKADLISKGLTLVADFRIGSLREAIFQGDKLRGVRLAVLEYAEDSAVEAIHKRREQAV
jgi:hypothetical protein